MDLLDREAVPGAVMSDQEKVEALARAMVSDILDAPMLLRTAVARSYAELLLEARELLRDSIEWIGNDGRALLAKLDAL